MPPRLKVLVHLGLGQIRTASPKLLPRIQVANLSKKPGLAKKPNLAKKPDLSKKPDLAKKPIVAKKVELPKKAELPKNAEPPTKAEPPKKAESPKKLLPKKRRYNIDPYKVAQSLQRKNANLKRREELKEQRTAEWGHIIWGRTTPFLESLDSGGQDAFTPELRNPSGDVINQPRPLPTTPWMRNHFLTDREVDKALSHAYTLTMPLPPLMSIQEKIGGPTKEGMDQILKEHDENHRKAEAVIRRITALSFGTAFDRKLVNTRRIINEFGRHKTDKTLTPRPRGPDMPPVEDIGRGGPDTGSSEVQIALLTAKIRNLGRALTVNRGSSDKHNRRNLRLLVHRRQKLLKYMQRKERGGERWTHMLEKLGLTPATWMGQIEV